MTDSISIAGLATSLMLPWLMGSILTYCLLSKSGRWNMPVILGHGYLVGIFITTVVMRLSDYFGLGLNFWALAAAVSGLAIIGLIAIQTQRIPARLAQPTSPVRQWEVAVIALLVALIAYRYITIVQELWLRPLFPWDAWMNWAPKAIVWFQNNELVPYIDRIAWLNQLDTSSAHTLGTGHYPPTVPLIQLWGMLGLGISDHTLIYLPWLMLTLSLGLALYGHLRLTGSSILLATLGCYALLNLPYINVHTALAGYADIWLATAFGLATFALFEWSKTRQWSYGVLSIFFAIVCTQLKIPGIILGAIVIAVIALYLIKFSFKTYLGFTAALVSISAYAILIGIHIEVPLVGSIALSTELIQIPHIGTFVITYHDTHAAFFNALFQMLNWNLFWYLLALITAIKLLHREFLTPPSSLLVSISFASLFLAFVYQFTNYYQNAEDFTSLNRALLYLLPSGVLYTFKAEQLSDT